MASNTHNELADLLKSTRPEVFRSSEYRAFRQSFLRYGVDMVAHAHLMRKSKELLIDGKMSIDEFISKYDLNFNESGTLYELNRKRFSEEKAILYSKLNGEFVGTLSSIQRDGVYIPDEAFTQVGIRRFKSKKDAEIMYFDLDYNNCLKPDDSQNNNLTRRKFVPSDLTSPLLSEQGLGFAKAVWQDCLDSFASQHARDASNTSVNREALVQTAKLAEVFKQVYSGYFEKRD